jgi:hypothetical protein
MAPQGFADLGERLTRALLAGDAAAYRALMALPLRIVPRDGEPYVLETPEALERDFALYHLAIRAGGVTDILRDLRDVSLCPDGGVRVSFRVQILAGTARLGGPFASEMTLVHDGEGLRIREIVSAREHIDWTLGRGNAGGEGFI